MKADKINKFMALAGQVVSEDFITGDEHKRRLGAQLLLSEVLEYVINGLGIVPEVDGTPIQDANGLTYKQASPPDRKEMLDGLADVAYTMYWNASAFGVPLEEAFELICDNNLQKFVLLERGQYACGALPQKDWHCERDIRWPEEVVAVEVIEVDGELYAVGKDARGKVRKPSSYTSVDLSTFLSAA